MQFLYVHLSSFLNRKFCRNPHSSSDMK
uniref:Uncharacterized protein n=1 Tax=Anguilla anguilla TaxID=7936 RepID=A0A0E9SAX7_ANGAN